ncbi:hypothetical protein B0H66DRAFT_143467 [Apodospora peruviana]|uniref:Uncharacterized protein n=1 Tax=Apodospora peruviana TaxID=516989 RepID=A0AAE0MBB8_9PEZI|nr:hypothetical protein B0H66DRAFT_143467 [Apodospora peruviana]
MAEHWLWAMDLVSILVAFLYGQDDDGMELYFTSSRKPEGTFREPCEFIEATHRMKPVSISGPTTPSATTAQPPINPSILRTVTTSTSSSNEFYREDISESLESILDQWSRKHAKREKKKLTLIILTDGIWSGVSDIVPDIIDHEPADAKGNIYKMILGSLDSRYDEEDETRAIMSKDAGSVLEDFANDKDDGNDDERRNMISQIAHSIAGPVRQGGDLQEDRNSQYTTHSSGGGFDKGPR